MKRFGRLAIILGFFLTGGLHSVAAQAQAGAEVKIKAAYIFNFTKFVSWPDGGRNLTICVDKNNPFDGTLKEIEARSNANRKYMVQENGHEEGCHILYSAGAVDAIPQDNHTLTVGEGDAFIEHGGIIAFITKDDKVKFIINLKAAEQAGLKLNPQLLEVAYKVVR